MIETRVAIYAGVFMLLAAVIGASSSIVGVYMTQAAQERQLRAQVQAAAVESEIVAFRAAIKAYLDQLTRAADPTLKASSDALHKELAELDRRAFSLSLFATTELIKATGPVQDAVNLCTRGEPSTGSNEKRFIERERFAWRGRARKFWNCEISP